MNFIKNDLRELREKIREERAISKDPSQDMASAQCNLHRLKGLYRIKHIFYCLMKGRTYKEIEPKVYEGNHIWPNDLKTLCLEYPMFNWDEISKEQLEGMGRW